MSLRSSSDVSVGEPPLGPPDSPGSSVSTRLQEEYDELLKYAVVVPDYNAKDARGKISDARGFLNREGDIITVKASARSGLVHDIEGTRHQHDEEEREGERTPLAGADNSGGGIRQLPDFGQSPVNSIVGSSAFSHHGRINASDEVGGGQPFLKTLLGDRARDNDDIGVNDAVDRAYTATMDRDVGKMETMMDQWCLELKRNVLAEFTQAKIIIEQKSRQELMRESSRHAKEKAELITEVDSMKEFLHTYEQTMARKDVIISNLTKAVYRQRDKVELMRNFSNWRIQHNDVKRESFTMQLARRHYERCLYRRVLNSWFSIIHRKWRQRVEKACQNKAQQVCLQVTSDYEAKITSLNEVQESSREEVRRLNLQREKYEETMKKAFMRGVCALNMEAMSMFHGDEHPDAPPQLADGGDGEEFYSDNLDSHDGEKGVPVSKSLPQDSVRSSMAPDPPPFRVVTSQGSRTVQTSTASHQTWARPKSSVTHSQKRVTIKGSDLGRRTGRSGSPSSHAPIASVVVERHQPVTKQTIGQATAVRMTKTVTDQDNRFVKLAGQGGVSKPTTIHTVRVVE